jgi:hypothetical protein
MQPLNSSHLPTHLISVLAFTCVASTSAAASSFQPNDHLSRATFPAKHKSREQLNTQFDSGLSIPGYVSYQTAPITASSATSQVVIDRETSEREQVIGELRQWQSLGDNWDGEGAKCPNYKSLAQASSFVCAMTDTLAMPVPMLHASGNAGLYWREENLYADLEFLGDNRVAYYIEYKSDRHKGVVEFDKQTIPRVFATLIWS